MMLCSFPAIPRWLPKEIPRFCNNLFEDGLIGSEACQRPNLEIDTALATERLAITFMFSVVTHIYHCNTTFECYSSCNMVFIHLANIFLLFGIISTFVYYGSNLGSHLDNISPQTFSSSWEKYGWFTLVLYLSQYLALLALPQAVFNFLGFLLFNPFPGDPQIEVKFNIIKLSISIWMLIKFSISETNFFSPLYMFSCGYQRRLSRTGTK